MTVSFTSNKASSVSHAMHQRFLLPGLFPSRECECNINLWAEPIVDFALRVKKSKSHFWYFLTCWAYKQAIHNYKDRIRQTRALFPFDISYTSKRDTKVREIFVENAKKTQFLSIFVNNMGIFRRIVLWENHILGSEKFTLQNFSFQFSERFLFGTF